LEDAGKEVEVSEQGFGGVEACAGVETCGVVEDFQEDLFVGAAGQPGMRGGVVLPERAVVACLPAFDGFAYRFVAGVGVELMSDGPATDTGTVGFEVEAAMEFTGNGTVGGGWFGREEFGDEGGDFGRPVRVMIPTGEPGRPGFGRTLSAGAEVIGVEFVEAGAGQPEFTGGGASAEMAGAMTVEEMTDQWSGQTMEELVFFMRGSLPEKKGFFALVLTPAGACRAARSDPTCRMPDFRRRSGCVPAEPYPPLKQGRGYATTIQGQ
jgi:hypothetical protein